MGVMSNVKTRPFSPTMDFGTVGNRVLSQQRALFGPELNRTVSGLDPIGIKIRETDHRRGIQADREIGSGPGNLAERFGAGFGRRAKPGKRCA